jgi:hypothetical protein
MSHPTTDFNQDQGVCLSAEIWMAFPVAEISSPAPAVVWQALRSAAAAKSMVEPVANFSMITVTNSNGRGAETNRDQLRRRHLSFLYSSVRYQTH